MSNQIPEFLQIPLLFLISLFYGWACVTVGRAGGLDYSIACVGAVVVGVISEWYIFE